MTNLLLTVPGPDINLYKSGFEGVCRLGRAKDGKKLSRLVEDISEPMVIAVDAPWGAGKSVFLKCWVGAHTQENQGKARTVYFDAFKHDFMDDPLIGLTGTINERLGESGSEAKLWRKAKEAASKLALPAIRMGLAIGTAGTSEYAGAVVDAALAAGSSELQKASEQFWRKEDGKRSAMQGFREALLELAAEQKLVIVVDELDRCRPDYALTLLEVIKHFFDVPNVHFVLGVNMKELANSVRARYGAGTQADRYLQKFVTLSMPLVPPRSQRNPSGLLRQHFEYTCEKLDLSARWQANWLHDYLRLVDHHAGLSLRDVEKIATLAAVTPEPSQKREVNPHLYAGLLILQVASPSAVEHARQRRLREEDVFQVFHLRKKPSESGLDFDAHVVWTILASSPGASLPQYIRQAEVELFQKQDPSEVLRDAIAETLDVFQTTF